jgi:hypothetical protein
MFIARFSIAATMLLLAYPQAQTASPPNPYAAIDQHALKASTQAEESIASLAKYLAQPCKSDKDKARVIYRWITDRIAYDIEGLLSGEKLDTKSESVLKSRKTTCDGYSNLYSDLAKEMNLEAVRIVGYAKGFDYTPGKPFAKANHAWNAVKLDGRWNLLDSTLKQFEEMPKVQPTLLKLNVAPDAIHAAMETKGFREFVFAFDIPGESTTMVKGPLDKFLKEGKEYSWSFRTNDFAKMVVVNGDKPVPIEKVGGEFRAKLKAQKGKLQIAAAEKPSDKRYSLVLEYVVE